MTGYHIRVSKKNSQSTLVSIISYIHLNAELNSLD
jgi:hypothetical protein